MAIPLIMLFVGALIAESKIRSDKPKEKKAEPSLEERWVEAIMATYEKREKQKNS